MILSQNPMYFVFPSWNSMRFCTSIANPNVFCKSSAKQNVFFMDDSENCTPLPPPPLPQQKKRWFLSKNALLSAIFKHYRPLISVILRGILIYAGILTFHCRVLFWIFWPMISLSLNIFPVFYQKNQKNTYYRPKKPKI